MIARLAIIVFVGVAGTSFALNAHLTHYCSFPPCCEDKSLKPPYTSAEKNNCKGRDECDIYSGCEYEGQFAYCGTKSHDWVVKNDIAAFFSTHGDQSKYINKKLRVKQGSKSIDVTVCDTCGDKDCDGCCTRNAGSSGYLIDMDANTYARFGGSDGPVTWTCLNC